VMGMILAVLILLRSHGIANAVRRPREAMQSDIKT
jgi:hypothetical protein